MGPFLQETRFTFCRTWYCVDQKVGCQELLARGRRIAYFRDNHNSCKGTDVTLANWPHRMLFGPFCGFACQQHFNLFLRCNHQDPKKMFSYCTDVCSAETKLNFPWNSRRQHSAQISLTPRKSQAGVRGGEIVLLQQIVNVNSLLGDNPLEVGFVGFYFAWKRVSGTGGWPPSHPHQLNNPSLNSFTWLSFKSWTLSSSLQKGGHVFESEVS